MTNRQDVLDVAGAISVRPASATGPLVTVYRAFDGASVAPGPGQVERVDDHVLIVPTAGTGRHSVDFVGYQVTPDRIIHVRPGQVQKWEQDEPFDADVVRIPADLCPRGLFLAAEPQPEVHLGSAGPVVSAIATDLRREQESGSPDPSVTKASAALLLHHVSRAAGTPSTQPSLADRSRQEGSPQVALVRAFRTELEFGFSQTRSVADYARRVGTSPKTLSRATAALTGRSPKELIDQRVILEACRLLACSMDSASSIGAGLGFSEATNFAKFFARNTGTSPHEFRQCVSIRGQRR